MTEKVTIELTPAQAAMWVAFTDQRCANFVAAADFVADLTEEQKTFLTQSDPATLKFLRTLRPKEVEGLQAYLALRTTGSYVLWGLGTLVAGFIAVTTVWTTIAAWLKR